MMTTSTYKYRLKRRCRNSYLRQALYFFIEAANTKTTGASLQKRGESPEEVAQRASQQKLQNNNGLLTLDECVGRWIDNDIKAKLTHTTSRERSCGVLWLENNPAVFWR